MLISSCLSPYKPYNKSAFLALIPPSFTSLNPFVACFRPLQPHSSKGVWKSRKLESGIGTEWEQEPEPEPETATEMEQEQ